MERETEIPDLRTGTDRRKRPTPFLGRHMLFGGRRKGVRREADRDRHVFVDVHGTGLWVVLLSLLLLAQLDAFLTLLLIDWGVVVEANPAMAFYLNLGDTPFLIAKTVLTGAALCVFCICKNFRIARLSLAAFVVIYLLVIAYELSILYRCSGTIGTSL